MCLVETTKGDILVVHIYFDNSEDEGGDEISRAYIVYKLIHDRHDFRLVPIKDLGGDSLF